MRPLIYMVVSLALLAACQRPPSRVAAAPSCQSAWQAAWSADSVLAICLPPGFAPAGAARELRQRWQRPLPEQPVGDWLSVSLDTTASTAAERWPPRLATDAPCSADCLSADSVVVHRDTIGGTEVPIETGLVSGGFAGFRQQPSLVAGWRTPRRHRIWVNGHAARPATLDTLRAMLRTLRLAEP